MHRALRSMVWPLPRTINESKETSNNKLISVHLRYSLLIKDRNRSANEIAEELEMTPYEVSDTLKISGKHLSLDAPFNQGDDNRLLDVIQDDHQPPPDDLLLNESLRIEVKRALTTLSGREAEVIKLYFGLGLQKLQTCKGCFRIKLFGGLKDHVGDLVVF